MTSPVAVTERLPTLDIARGIAILLVVFVNIVAMGGPQIGMFDPAAQGPVGGLDHLAHQVVRVLISGKFISIFALLFGMGMAIQTARLDRDGTARRVYLRRQGLLLIMGVLHGVFLWWGDILFTYGAIGLVVFTLRDQKPRDLRRFGAALMGVGVIAQVAGILSIASLPAAMPTPELLEEAFGPQWTALPDRFRQALSGGPFQMLTELELAAFRDGGFFTSLALRTALFFGQAIGGAMTLGLWIAGLMLLGMSFVREGFLDDPARQDWWIRWGIPIGLGMELLTSAVLLGTDAHFPEPISLLAEAATFPARSVLALGWFALICRLVPQVPALRMFAPAGRMALTIYLTQSFVLYLVFAPWTFRAFGSLGPAELFGICVGLGIVQLAFAHLWLRFFDRGPFEAGWRALTYRS